MKRFLLHFLGWCGVIDSSPLHLRCVSRKGASLFCCCNISTFTHFTLMDSHWASNILQLVCGIWDVSSYTGICAALQNNIIFKFHHNYTIRGPFSAFFKIVISAHSEYKIRKIPKKYYLNER